MKDWMSSTEELDLGDGIHIVFHGNVIPRFIDTPLKINQKIGHVDFEANGGGYTLATVYYRLGSPVDKIKQVIESVEHMLRIKFSIGD